LTFVAVTGLIVVWRVDARPLPLERSLLDLPKKLAQYQILGRIALGGMAEVYKAVSRGVEGFEKVVAIKRILPHVAEDEEFITMFKDEARIAAQLQHSNIAQIYELKSEGESFYIVLESCRSARGSSTPTTRRTATVVRSA